MAGLVLHQAGNCVFSVRSRGKHVARFSVRLAAPARRSRNFLGASREAAQREPCRKRGEFFILRPRRAERPSQFSKSAQQRGRPGAQRLLGDLQKSPLSYFDGGEPGTFRRRGKGFAEEFSVGSVFPEAISKLQLVAWMPCLSSSDCSL